MENSRELPDRKSKISGSDRTILLSAKKQEVIGLHIPENDSLCMTLGYEPENASYDVGYLLLCVRSFLDSVQDASSLTKLHHHMNVSRILIDILYDNYFSGSL